MGSVAIIGGGASGLAAAISCAQAATADIPCEITVFEAADRVGKSVLISGNGRCNFSNASVCADEYYNASFVREAFAEVAPAEVLAFFDDLGLVWREEAQGWLFPKTGKGSSVLDVLRLACRDLGVTETCGAHAITVTPVGKQFLIAFDDESTAFFDAVIIACGRAVCRSLLPPSYQFINTVPILGPLATETEPIKGLDGIRARVEMSCSGHAEVGEVLFRKYGISGVVVFNLSRFARPGDLVAIDFMPEADDATLTKNLIHRIERFPQRNAVDVLAGLVLPRVAHAVLHAVSIGDDRPLPRASVATCVSALKAFPLTVTGIGDVSQYQVYRGGFAVDAFDPQTMQSKNDPGLFMTGEALDVDGPCGGYNLHWAWTSGVIAGTCAAGVIDHA